VDLIALLLSLAAATGCESAAEAWVAKAEAHPMPKRAAVIRAAFSSDDNLACGLWTAASLKALEVLPQGCPKDRAACEGARTLELPSALVKDVAPATVARVQRLAQLLSKAGKLSGPHRRLLETWLLSEALSRGG